MKKILYIGTIDTYNYYKEGKNPSHWLYGAVEMEKDGHKVIWEQESSDLWNDYKLIKQHQPDIIFIPNFKLHHGPQRKKGIKAIIYSILLSGCKHLFFLSEKTMAVIVTHGLVKKEKCSILQWGADSIFYNNIKTKNTGYFVSTGKEQRDFNILIEAFKKTGAPLKIITCKSHAGNNFENLPDRCNGITNIEVIITENSGEIYPQMVQAMANAQALVCPLRQDKLNYCVGLSTIVDAEGLRKPLIITHNPYHSEERMHSFHVVKTLEEWIEAIHSIQISKKEIPITCYNMQKCYKAMKVIMKL